MDSMAWAVSTLPDGGITHSREKASGQNRLDGGALIAMPVQSDPTFQRRQVSC